MNSMKIGGRKEGRKNTHSFYTQIHTQTCTHTGVAEAYFLPVEAGAYTDGV
jgi:hypothetical protein